MKRIIYLLALLVPITFAFTMHQGYHIGNQVANFSLKNIDESMVSLEDYKDEKGVIVVFTCNHCPFSKAYEDRIIELDKEYKDKGFPVIAINPNDSEKYPSDSYENMKIRAKNKGFTFPYLHDESQGVARIFGAQKTPHVYLLKNQSGQFAVAYIGAIDNNAKDASAVNKHYLKDAVNSLIAGNEIETKETKAIGCSVKWKS